MGTVQNRAPRPCRIVFPQGGHRRQGKGAIVNRRTFLQLLSTTAILPIFKAAEPVHAATGDGLRHRMGLNISGMSYWATEQAFSNLAYNAARWRVQIKNAPFTWDTPLPPMTDDGYPLEVPRDSVMDSFLIFTPHRKNLPVKLSVLYDGKGRMGYVGGAEIEARFPGRDDVRNLRNGDAFTARLVETDPTDPLRNIRVYERNSIPKNTFREPFLERLQGMSALRFMDWMGTNNSKVRHWDDRPKIGQFGRSDEGVPLEHMIELCNLTGIDPWFNMPHLADDTYVRSFAEQVRKNLDPALQIHVEYSNEVWNMIFEQADYAGKRGLELGFSKDGYEAQLRYYAHRTTQILRLWEEVFDHEKDRIIGVYSAQSVNDWTSKTILSWEGVQEHADVLAIAPYFGGGLGAPETATEISRWPLDRLFAELEKEIDGENKAFIQTQVGVARRYNLKLYAYEGGQHLVGYNGAENNEALTDLFIAANRDPRMGELYKRHLKSWWDAGGDLYAVFASMGEPSKWGSWGLLEIEGKSHPKWDAVQAMLQQR